MRIQGKKAKSQLRRERDERSQRAIRNGKSLEEAEEINGEDIIQIPRRLAKNRDFTAHV
jgi:hypothetical protein